MQNRETISIPVKKWKIFVNLEEGDLDIISIDSNGYLINFSIIQIYPSFRGEYVT